MYENISRIVSDRHLTAMKTAISVLSKKPYLDYIDAIYLFGSCARGEQKYHSDVDLLVQCRESVPPEIMRSMSVAVMPEEMDSPEVELKFVRGNGWKMSDDCFSRNLVREGVLVWETEGC